MTIKIELSISQLVSVVLTIIGLCFILYFFALLNARLMVVDFQNPIYGWTEIYEAIPYGSIAIVFGFLFIFVGLILNVWGLVRKGRISPPPP